MSSHLGRRAVVIGAGLGGLSAAGALSPYFENVVVLESPDIQSRIKACSEAATTTEA